jgi:hypothetical protein
MYSLGFPAITTSTRYPRDRTVQKYPRAQLVSHESAPEFRRNCYPVLAWSWQPPVKKTLVVPLLFSCWLNCCLACFIEFTIDRAASAFSKTLYCPVSEVVVLQPDGSAYPELPLTTRRQTTSCLMSARYQRMRKQTVTWQSEKKLWVGAVARGADQQNL